MAPALLIALIVVFANFNTISKYASACMNGQVPDRYVRIDYAHLKKVVRFSIYTFKSNRIRKFFEIKLLFFKNIY